MSPDLRFRDGSSTIILLLDDTVVTIEPNSDYSCPSANAFFVADKKPRYVKFALWES